MYITSWDPLDNPYHHFQRIIIIPLSLVFLYFLYTIQRTIKGKFHYLFRKTKWFTQSCINKALCCKLVPLPGHPGDGTPSANFIRVVFQVPPWGETLSPVSLHPGSPRLTGLREHRVNSPQCSSAENIASNQKATHPSPPKKILWRHWKTSSDLKSALVGTSL